MCSIERKNGVCCTHVSLKCKQSCGACWFTILRIEPCGCTSVCVSRSREGEVSAQWSEPQRAPSLEWKQQQACACGTQVAQHAVCHRFLLCDDAPLGPINYCRWMLRTEANDKIFKNVQREDLRVASCSIEFRRIPEPTRFSDTQTLHHKIVHPTNHFRQSALLTFSVLWPPPSTSTIFMEAPPHHTLRVRCSWGRLFFREYSMRQIGCFWVHKSLFQNIHSPSGNL